MKSLTVVFAILTIFSTAHADYKDIFDLKGNDRIYHLNGYTITVLPGAAGILPKYPGVLGIDSGSALPGQICSAPFTLNNGITNQATMACKICLAETYTRDTWPKSPSQQLQAGQTLMVKSQTMGGFSEITEGLNDRNVLHATVKETSQKVDIACGTTFELKEGITINAFNEMFKGVLKVGQIQDVDDLDRR